MAADSCSLSVDPRSTAQLVCRTLMFLVASKPSSWLSSSNIVLCTSLSPPEPPSRRDEPMESISSMKMMEGACSLAMTNSSRTMRAPAGGTEANHNISLVYVLRGAAKGSVCVCVCNPGSRCGDTDSCSPSPMNFWTSSEPDTLMKVQSVWWATALASRVFPVPGGPYNSTPCTHYRGLHQYFPVVSAAASQREGWKRESVDVLPPCLCRFPEGSLAPAHSPKTCIWDGLKLSLGASEIGCCLSVR